MGLSCFALFAAFFLAGCGGPEESTGGGDGPSSGSEAAGSGETVQVAGGEALVWGEGDRGAVLAHGAAYDAASWREQAERLAGSGVAALAVEDTSAQSVAEAAGYLKEERGVRDVTLIGASAGTSGVLGAAEEDPGLADGVILLSGTGEVSGLGEYPKLFVASEGEGLAGTVRTMAEEAPGGRNEVLILPGDAHAQAIFESDQGEKLTRTILERLEDNG
ncbi:MAG: alpha/beta hydrolase, partial [Actinomycetota bacterium]|nr:alpha/beta hydrolase [Actinomycetota bacterium]